MNAAGRACLRAALLNAIERWLERDVRPHVMRLERDDIYLAEMVGNPIPVL